MLDANALTGFFEDRGLVAEKVRHLLGEALRHEERLLMSAVNWGEVFYVSWRRHGEAKAREALAAELAIERGAWLVTADPEFAKIGKGLSLYPLPRHEKK